MNFLDEGHARYGFAVGVLCLDLLVELLLRHHLVERELFFASPVVGSLDTTLLATQSNYV